MLVRLALETDEDAVIELGRMQQEETLPHLDFVEWIARDTFQNYLKTADPTFFVAEENGVVIGHLMALIQGYAFTDGIYVVQEVLYVKPDKRGTRAAAALVKAFVEWGERLKAREIIFGISNKFQPERTAKFFELTAGAEQVGIYLKRVRG